MSLVGPRPYLPRESDEMGEAKSEILRVPPGITGPWQVSGRNHATFAERVELDVYYVHDWSLWLEIVLLAGTVRNLFVDRGAYLAAMSSRRGRSGLQNTVATVCGPFNTSRSHSETVKPLNTDIRTKFSL
jgi:hypothetical protein